MECLTWILLSSEFACFVAGEIIQVIEAMPGSVVPLAMFANRIKIWSSGDITSKVRRLSTRLSHLHCHIALHNPIDFVRRELSVLWTSRRASAQAVTSKRYIRTTSPVNTYSSGVKTDSRRKTGRSSETKRATGDRWVPKRPKFRCRRRRRFGFFR